MREVKQKVKQSYGRTPAFQAGHRDSNSLGGTNPSFFSYSYCIYLTCTVLVALPPALLAVRV